MRPFCIVFSRIDCGDIYLLHSKAYDGSQTPIDAMIDFINEIKPQNFEIDMQHEMLIVFDDEG